MSQIDQKFLTQNLIPTVLEAGKNIMTYFETPLDIATKANNSPVTEADQVAEDLILRDLKQFCPEIPVVAEESLSQGARPHVEDIYFLVDPLDGTREFINQRPEFTVNIGLIENKCPVFGIILAPALGELYVTLDLNSVGRLDTVFERTSIDVSDFQPIACRLVDREALHVLASRSHLDDATIAYLDDFSVANTVNAGSSLKFCRLAEGRADLYPRFGPTMEWDTAAGQAILQAAGGTVENLDGTSFLYGKVDQEFKNPGFIAWGRR
ncbi:MAG: 3'(2'),5'-bisphosphate nucleotidase CysQ [Methyloligellaceae bacterium]